MIYHTVYPDYWYWLRKWLPKWNTNEQKYPTLIVCVEIVMVSVVASENQSWRFFLCCWRRLRQQWAPSGNCLEEVWYWGRRCGRHSHTWWWCRGWWHFSSSPIWYGSWRFKYCPRLPASQCATELLWSNDTVRCPKILKMCAGWGSCAVYIKR